MDPLTHTLVGASLAATRLGSTTRRAGVALVVGANLPDVDALAYLAGGDAALGFRRGWTHGVPAMLLLPALLALLIRCWPAPPRGEPDDLGLSTPWLLGLCYLAVATHPFLDWLNTYGMRWWMPFSDAWAYGDSVFIMDPWLWLALGVGWLSGRVPTKRLLAAWALLTALLCWVGVARAPGYTPLIVAVALALLAALWWRPGPAGRGRAAAAGLVLAVLYILSMLSLHAVTERRVEAELAHVGVGPVDRLMAGPLPANPLAWDVVARAGRRIHVGRFSWLHGRALELSDVTYPAAEASDDWQAVTASGQAPGFLGWVRFPWLETERADGARRVHLMDARYVRRRTSGFGSAVVTLPGD